MKSETRRPTLCFVGPMVGRNAGYVTTQGEIVAELLSKAGYSVISVSHLTNRYLRLLHIVVALLWRCKKIDIQCLQVFGGPSFVVEDIASGIAKLCRKPIVMFLHGGAMPEFMARYPRWSRRVLNRADVIVTPSEYLARAIAKYGFRAEVVSNVIDIRLYKYQHRKSARPRLLWMRAFQPIYNPEMALRVVAQLRTMEPDVELAMGGQDKGFEASARQQAKNLGLNGSVRFTGFLDQEGKLREASTADIFINTNRIDNTPVGLIEACAMGLPIVTTAVGGISDLLTHGETALLVPDNDDEAMVRAIQRLLAEPELVSRLSSNGRRVAERSSWERVKPQLEKLFEQLMLNHRASYAVEKL